MKLLILVLLFVAVIAAEKPLDEEWKDFKIKYKRDFGPDEEAERFEIFKKTYNKVVEHNKKHEKGEVTHTLGINKFADRKPEELPLGSYKKRT